MALVELHALPVVDVVVVTHNGSEFLPLLVESIRADSAVNASVVVVDNRSADTTISVARDLGCRVVAMDRNSGYGRGCMAGLEASESEWVLFCNQDIELMPGALSTLVAAARLEVDECGRAAVVGPALRRPDGVLAETCHDLPTLLSTVVALVFGDRAGRFRNAYPAGTRPQHCGWMSGACLLASRKVLVEVGGFDPSYFMYVEDVDLFSRVQAAGHHCVWVPEAVAVHHGGRRPVPPEIYATALRNWGRYWRRRRGWAAGALVGVAAVTGALLRAGMWWVRSAGGDPNARHYRRMFLRAAGLAIVGGDDRR